MVLQDRAVIRRDGGVSFLLIQAELASQVGLIQALGLMTDTPLNSTKKFHRLLAIALFIVGVMWLIDGFEDQEIHLMLFAVGMIFMGIFALRHNVFDSSPQGLDPSSYGKVDVALLFGGVLLCLTSAVMLFAA